jgi:class 3 adenylate cyclase
MGTRGRREESICSDHDLFSDSLTNLAWREHVRSSAGTDGLEWRLKPIYLSRWDEDFSASRFPRKEIVICAGVIFIFMAAAFATDITKESDFGFGIHFLTYSGELIASVVSGCFVVLLSLPRSRAWFTRYHEGLTMFWIIMVFVTYLQSLFMSDYRLQLFEVRTELEFSNMTHGKPSAFRRNCTESHYEMTLQSWPYFYEPGCLSTMSGAGGSFGFLIVLFMVAPQFHVSPRKAAIGSVIMGLCYATLGLADGWTGGNFVACLALLIATGGLATILCDTELTKARQEFALSKGIVYASTQKRRLLNTIIPPNVLEHMDQSNKAVPISRVTVLFCRVRLTVEDTATFDLMNSLFLALDGLVKNSGMFKYQHVCTGSEIFYIVGCPRMACPYDDSVQALRYPHKETLVSMIRLAADINKTVNSFGRAGQGSAGIQRNGDKAIATAAHWRRQPVAHHTSPVSSSSEILPISVHMGLCSGPVAGIVLGKCRRFYCVYGDTVNVAARMCQLACPGQMMAPAGLYYQQGEQGVEEGKASRGDLDGESGEEESGESAAGVSGNSVEDEMAKLGFTIRRGWKKVKGKGQMQVDEVIFGSLDQVHRGVGVGCGGGVVGFDAPSGPRQSGDECNAVAGATAGEKEAAHADNKVETGWDRRRRRSSILSEAEVSGAVLESGAMGNLLVQQFKEPRHEVDKRWARFRHPSMELQFVKEQIPLERRVLSCAILWHASFALWQMQMIMMPDIPEYWQTFEVEELERRRRIATAALVINVVIITVTGGALLVMLWYEVICESRRTGGLASWLTCACVRKQGSAACSWSSVLFRGGRSCPVKPRVSSLLQSLEGGQRGSGEGLLPTPGRFKACVYGFMALKILNWVLMGFCANTWLARRGVSVLHSTMALYNFGISYSHMGVSFRLQAAMHAISLVAFIISAAGWLSGLSLFQRVGSQVVPKFLNRPHDP